MKKTKQTTVVCQVCGKQKNYTETIRAASIRDAIASIIRKAIPSWSPDGYICREDLQKFRTEYLHSLLESEKGELSRLDQEVLQSLQEQELLSENVNDSFKEKLDFGDRLADTRIGFDLAARYHPIRIGVIAEARSGRYWHIAPFAASQNL